MGIQQKWKKWILSFSIHPYAHFGERGQAEFTWRVRWEHTRTFLVFILSLLFLWMLPLVHHQGDTSASGGCSGRNSSLTSFSPGLTFLFPAGCASCSRHVSQRGRTMQGFLPISLNDFLDSSCAPGEVWYYLQINQLLHEQRNRFFCDNHQKKKTTFLFSFCNLSPLAKMQ